MRPRREPRISDEVVGIGHVQASTGEQLAFSFGLNGHLASNDGVDVIGWLDVLVTGICVLIIVVLIALFPCVVRLVGRIRSLLTRVDRLKNVTILHGMVRLGVELARSFQCFGIVFFIVAVDTVFCT